MPVDRSMESGEPLTRSRSGTLLLAAGLVTALGSAGVLVFAEDLRLMRLAIVAALWAALAGAFIAARYRGQSDERAEQVADLQAVYELELEREIAARREYEMQVEAQVRAEMEQQSRRDLDALRGELRSLRQTLESLMTGEVMVERYALQAEATRMRPLSERQTPVKRLAAAGGGAEPVTQQLDRIIDVFPVPGRGPDPTPPTQAIPLRPVAQQRAETRSERSDSAMAKVTPRAARAKVQRSRQPTAAERSEPALPRVDPRAQRTEVRPVPPTRSELSQPAMPPSRPPTRSEFSQPAMPPTRSELSQPAMPPSRPQTRQPTRSELSQPAMPPSRPQTRSEFSQPAMPPSRPPTRSELSQPAMPPSRQPTRPQARPQTRSERSEPAMARVEPPPMDPRPPTRSELSQPAMPPSRPPTRAERSEPAMARVEPPQTPPPLPRRGDRPERPPWPTSAKPQREVAEIVPDRPSVPPAWADRPSLEFAPLPDPARAVTPPAGVPLRMSDVEQPRRAPVTPNTPLPMPEAANMPAPPRRNRRQEHPAEVSDRWFVRDTFPEEPPRNGRHASGPIENPGGRRRRDEPQPEPSRHGRPEETGGRRRRAEEPGGGRRRAEDSQWQELAAWDPVVRATQGSRRAPEPTGGQPKSVADLLAAYNAETPRRRRRRDDQ
jgi:hypothetical protein